MIRNASALVILLLFAIPAMARTRTVRQISMPWQQPQCAQISGMPWVRYIDAGNQVHSVDPALEAIQLRRGSPETNAIAAATAANVLFATMTDGSIFQSSDAG